MLRGLAGKPKPLPIIIVTILIYNYNPFPLHGTFHFPTSTPDRKSSAVSYYDRYAVDGY